MQRNKLSTTFITINAIIAWLVYACAYIVLKNNPSTTTLAGYFSLVGEVGLDIVAAVLAFRLWRKTEEYHTKVVFLVFSIAFIAAIAADGIYNVVLNLFQFQYINPIIVSLFDVPFALFLLFQLIAWGWILFSNREVPVKARKSSYISYAIVSVLMFVMFMFGISWKIEYFSLLGLFQVVDTTLEVIGFALATICLARAKTPLIRFAAIGYLLVVSSDFIIRYHVVSGLIPYLSSLEATWVLGLLLMCLGFFLIPNNKRNESFQLLPVNSLQSQIAIWLLILWLVSAFLFSGSYYLFSSDIGHHLNQITKNLLSLLVPLSVLAIISSSYISTKISSPLSRLEDVISSFIGADNVDIPKSMNPKDNFIFEFITLENFVLDSFSLYKKKHHLEMEFAKTASQVAHDIKSPLIALDNLSKNLIRISDDQRDIISSSINRISEITENLLAKHRFLHGQERTSQLLQNTVEMIFPILENMVLEKKVQFDDRKVNITFVPERSTENTFCLINATEFKRVISNLINNAVESIDGSGHISIFLRQDFNSISIEIKDTGCGIPKEILDGLGNGVSYKKERGNGLGLKHAISCIAEWGGSYIINTKENFGTSFNINLPIQEFPDWIQREIHLLENPVVVIVDDDLSIYNLWKEKLNKWFQGISSFTIIHLISPEELEEYVISKYSQIKDKCSVVFLVDYYFPNSNVNGIDAIKNNSLAEKSFLVTTQYPDKTMKDALYESNIKMVLKKDINKIPINVVFTMPDLILLDDKRLVTKTWSLEAIKHGKKIVTFNSIETFMRYIDFFHKNTDIFLDSDLGDEKGENIAKELFKRGFRNLYITTGFDIQDFPALPWIKGVIGKEPIFINDSIRVNDL